MALGRRGAFYLARLDNDRAIADFNQAIQIEPSNAITHYNRGHAHKNKGDLDQAMINYTEAIRLDPAFSRAYSFRGNVYRDRNDFDRAIADYDEAIRHNPKDSFAYNIRGSAYRAKGDVARAMADYSESIRLDPKYHVPYLNRGIFHVYSGAYAEARDDFQRAIAITPTSIYNMIWLEIAQRRDGLPGDLAQSIKKATGKNWPMAVARLFLGEATPEAVLAAPDSEKNLEKKAEQLCDARLYVAEFVLLKGQKDEAERFYRLAENECPRKLREWGAASAALRTLDATRR